MKKSIIIIILSIFGIFSIGSDLAYSGNEKDEIPEIFFDRKSSMPNEPITLTVRDETKNKNDSDFETVRVTVYTKKIHFFSTAHLEETTTDSGVFSITFKPIQFTNQKEDTLFAVYEYLDDGRQKQISINLEIIPEKVVPTSKKEKYVLSTAIQNSYLGLSSQVSIIPDKTALPTGPWSADQSTCPYCVSNESQNSFGKWEFRIDSKVRNLEGLSNPSQYASETILPYTSSNNEIQVLAKIENWENNLNLIRTLGFLERQAGDYFQISVPVETLQDFAQTPGLKWAKPPTSPHLHANLLKSEGVEFIQADIPQIEGYSGNGVTIAILDLAFDITNNEISDKVDPNDINIFRSRLGQQIPVEGISGLGEEAHGTGVAEIILDVAPQAKLHLYTVGTEVEFIDAIDHIINKDTTVDLIAMSLGWPNYITDGTSPMTLKIEEAIESGIPVVISAGNYAEMHWEGVYSDSEIVNGMHEFDGIDEIQGIYVDQNLNPILIFLVWDNKADNFDLFLRHESSEEILDQSRNIQTRNTGEAYEYLSYQPQKSGMYEFGISCVLEGGCNPNTVLEVFSVTNTFEHSTPKGSVGVPVDAQGVISVGSIDFRATPFRPYSSQGPANNQLDAPLLVAPDGVKTTAYEKYGGKPFFGTSAAAPHVAGVAALMLEKEPELTPAELLANLRDFADENSVPLVQTPDNKFGFGKVDASFIVTGKKFQGRLIDFPDYTQEENTIPETILEESEDLVIPDWIKQNAAWWSAGEIDDASFLSGIQFMVQNEIIKIPGQAKYLKLSADKFEKPISRTAKTEISISGFVEDYHQGSYVSMDIIKPDGTIEEQKLIGAGGNFFTNYYLDMNSQIGLYKLIIKYQGIEVDSIEFEVADALDGPVPQEIGTQVPQWIRSNADWWAKGLISDKEFAAGITFLIKEAILIV